MDVIVHQTGNREYLIMMQRYDKTLKTDGKTASFVAFFIQERKEVTDKPQESDTVDSIHYTIHYHIGQGLGFQFLHNVLAVRDYRCQANVQFVCDLLVDIATTQQRCHFHLARRKNYFGFAPGRHVGDIGREGQTGHGRHRRVRISMMAGPLQPDKITYQGSLSLADIDSGNAMDGHVTVHQHNATSTA